MCPSYGKAWVSWAQMEKRTRAAGAGDHLARCRMVLQQGLSLNPDSAPLCQVSLCLPASPPDALRQHLQSRQCCASRVFALHPPKNVFLTAARELQRDPMKLRGKRIISAVGVGPDGAAAR